MSKERQDKENKKTTEKITVKREDNLRSKITFDNIRKEINFLEQISRRSWAKKYEYLTGQFFSEVLVEECRKAGLPVDTFKHDPPEDTVKHSPIPLKPLPTVPRTTSATIGHRSSHAEYNLEFLGHLYISPKWTIEPPMDNLKSCMTQQKFICLG